MRTSSSATTLTTVTRATDRSLPSSLHASHTVLEGRRKKPIVGPSSPAVLGREKVLSISTTSKGGAMAKSKGKIGGGKEKPNGKKKAGIIKAIKMELKGGAAAAGHARGMNKEHIEEGAEWEWSNEATCAADEASTSTFSKLPTPPRTPPLIVLPFLLSHLSLTHSFPPLVQIAGTTPKVPSRASSEWDDEWTYEDDLAMGTGGSLYHFDFLLPSSSTPSPTTSTFTEEADRSIHRMAHPSISSAAFSIYSPLAHYSGSKHYHHHSLPATELDHTPKTSERIKRPADTHSHLFSRTKKLKISHRFFRSELLLLGPTSPPAPSSIPLPPIPEHSITAAPVITKPTKYQPSLRRQAPNWWASVSRSNGESRGSKMGPGEESWVGQGEGWDTLTPSHKGLREAGATPSTTSTGGQGSREHTKLKSWQSRFGRKFTGHATSQTSSSSSAAPLKQHLLAVLRMRLNEGGGSSKGGEAGLRFKKWVVWNSWMKRTAAVTSPPAPTPASAPVAATSSATNEKVGTSSIATSVMEIDQQESGSDTLAKGKAKVDGKEWSSSTTDEHDRYTTTSTPSSSTSETPRNSSSLPLPPTSSPSIPTITPRVKGTRMTRRKSQEESERGLLAIQQLEGTGLEMEVEAALAVVSA